MLFICFVLCAGLVAWSGASIFEAYGLLLKGALGSGFALSETFARATPLIFTGLAAAIAFKSRFWNIGDTLKIDTRSGEYIERVKS